VDNMIYSIKGKITEIFNDSLIINVRDIGYQIFTTSNLLESVNKGEEIKIFSYPIIRENNHTIELYGFKTEKMLKYFKLLKDISRIGPKSSIKILSLASISNLNQAIVSEDTEILTKVSGIGKKTAKRIILELKGKLKQDKSGQLFNKKDILVIEALKKMGYSSAEIRKAIKKVPDTISETQKRLKRALKILSK